jgi:hypothetical protein
MGRVVWVKNGKQTSFDISILTHGGVAMARQTLLYTPFERIAIAMEEMLSKCRTWTLTHTAKRGSITSLT